MNSTDRFAALLTMVIAMLTMAGAALHFLIRISWRLGQLVQQLNSHLEEDAEVRRDTEQRIRSIEAARRRQR